MAFATNNDEISKKGYLNDHFVAIETSTNKNLSE